MLKNLIENFIRRIKNQNFSFDYNISSRIIWSYGFSQFINLIRGYRFYNYKKRGRLLFFGKNVSLFNRSNIRFGENVLIGNYVKLSALGKKPLKIGNNVNIGSFSQLIISTSFNNVGEFIDIGDNVGMGEFSYIGGGGGTSIGANTIIGQYLSMHPENHNFSDNNKLIRNQGVTRKGIKIGKNCWIGSKVTVLDGVEIGDNCVIAAGSVVIKSFPNNSLIGGVPAKVLKSL
jgi:acetyltransferase-like isoleucine patch superfamily enzyme